MFTFSKNSSHALCQRLALGLLLCALIPRSAAADGAIPLAVGETWRDPGAESGASVCFELSQDRAGILVLELVTSTAAPAAGLHLLAAGSETFRRLHQGVASLMLDGPATSHRVCVEAEDPRQPLSPFRLQSRFVATACAPHSEKSETDGELEIDPDPFVAEPLFPSAECRLAKSETDGELEIDPDPLWSDPLESDPLGSDPQSPALGAESHDLPGVIAQLAPWRAALCGQGEMDDHSDGFLCATTLSWGEEIRGEIGNGWGDDSDVFRFHLSTLTTVELAARGEVELAGEVYDRHGMRLASLDGGLGGGVDGLRWVRTLVPGTYFVRLAGRHGAAGKYSLELGAPGK